MTPLSPLNSTIFFGLFLLGLVSPTKLKMLKLTALMTSFIVLFQTILYGMTPYSGKLTNNIWFNSELVNFSYLVNFDELTYWFILLTSLLIPLCMMGSWSNIKFKLKWFFMNLLLVELMLINMFSSSDLFFFYVWFETILLPMYLLIGIWGSRQSKTYASFMFFFYTFMGSLFLLFGLFLIYSHTGSFAISSLMELNFSPFSANLIWMLFFIAFAVKVPMFPAHIWLPEAHVEAPTVGSVLLAGVLLKLGMFAILRFLFPMFPDSTSYFAPMILMFALLGMLYMSCTTVRQTDLKKMIAYASVAHMNYVVLGLFAPNLMSWGGVVFLMLGHGMVSAGLFFMMGFLYDRYRTRVISYYGGLVQFMPLYALSFFMFTLANMSFPGTCNFIGEALILLGVAQVNLLVTALSLIGMIFCAIYSIWLYNSMMFGPISQNLSSFSDISYKEFMTVLPLLFFTFILGLFPNVVLSDFEGFFYFLGSF